MPYITDLQAAHVRIKELELREKIGAEAYAAMKARAEKAEAVLKAGIAWADEVPAPYREFSFITQARAIISKL